MGHGRWIALCILLAAICGGVALLRPTPWLGPFATVTTCYTDNRIAADKRQTIEAAASRFFATLFGASPQNAYGQMSVKGRVLTSPDQLAAIAAQLTANHRSLSPRLTHIFFIDGLLGTPTVVRVNCGSEWVAYSSEPKEAHAFYQLGNGSLRYDVWLVEENARWRIDGFSSN